MSARVFGVIMILGVLIIACCFFFGVVFTRIIHYDKVGEYSLNEDRSIIYYKIEDVEFEQSLIEYTKDEIATQKLYVHKSDPTRIIFDNGRLELDLIILASCVFILSRFMYLAIKSPKKFEKKWIADWISP